MPSKEFERLKAENQKMEEKEKIELIENLPLDYQGRMSLALLYLKKQPAILAEVSRRIYKGEEKEVLNQLDLEKEQVIKSLEKIGFVYWVKKFKIEEEKTHNLGYKFSISKNPENLSRLLMAIKNRDDKEIGLALGYPESACEAFVNETLLDYEKMPKEEKEKLIKQGASKFIFFHLSQYHWQKELTLIRNWQRTLKEKAPRLYEYAIKQGIDIIKE